MDYFIPAWYRGEKWWRAHLRSSANRQSRSEFDELVSVMNMYTKNDVPFKMLVLSHFPHLRTYLHRNGLYESDYWSMFDDIQGFRDKEARALDYRTLDWPENSDFVYTSQIVKCYTDGHYADIHYAIDGYLLWIDYYGEQKMKHLFDDRGMLSSIIYYEGDHEVRADYLNAAGEVVLSNDLARGIVTAGEAAARKVGQTTFSSMPEFLKAYFAYYVQRLQPQDRVIAGASLYHHELVRLIKRGQLCLSIFRKRNKLGIEEQRMFKDADYFLVDTMKAESILLDVKGALDLPGQVMRITPFAPEFLQSFSNQLYNDYIGFYIDRLDDGKLQFVLGKLEEMMAQNAALRVICLTRKRAHELPHSVTEAAARINQRFKTQPVNSSGLVEEEADAVQIEEITSDAALSKTMAKLRILIDAGSEPDLYMQINAISAGIPQINTVYSDYVSQKSNGYIIADLFELEHALRYFLDHLKNWNIAQTYSKQLVLLYSSANIIETLRAFIGGTLDEDI